MWHLSCLDEMPKSEGRFYKEDKFSMAITKKKKMTTFTILIAITKIFCLFIHLFRHMFYEFYFINK